MLIIRVVWAIIATVGLFVCVVGGLVLPLGALLGWAALGMGIGMFAWFSANDGMKRRGRAGRPTAETGIIVGAETFVGCLLTVGAAAFLGGVAWLLGGLALLVLVLVIRLRPRLYRATDVRMTGPARRYPS